MLEGYESWAELYEHEELDVIRGIGIERDAEFECEDEESEENPVHIEQNLFEMLSSYQNCPDIEELGSRLIDVAYEWKTAGNDCPTMENVEEFLSNYKNEMLENKIVDDGNVKFSDDQSTVLKLVDSQLDNIIGQSDNSISRRTLVQGKAGSGKSTVIKEIVKRVRSQLGTNSIEVVAPTGVAAINVDGKTLHSLFKLPLFSVLERTVRGTQRKYCSTTSNVVARFKIHYH